MIVEEKNKACLVGQSLHLAPSQLTLLVKNVFIIFSPSDTHVYFQEMGGKYHFCSQTVNLVEN